MMCEIRWTMTLQFRQKVLRFPVLPVKNRAICLVFWTFKMIADNPGEPQDPLFLIKTPHQSLSLSANQLIYRLRKWPRIIGEDDMQYSLHSLCGGGHIRLSIGSRSTDDQAAGGLGQRLL